MGEPNRGNANECPACDEAESGVCLYHDGWDDGYMAAVRHFRAVIEAGVEQNVERHARARHPRDA